jgi:hypothetical protein
MNYFLRMLSTIGWIWAGLFAVFLVIRLQGKNDAPSAPRRQERQEEKG